MSNYIAAVFETEKKASAGLHQIWQMDSDSEMTVHGAATLRRDDLSGVQVSHKHTDAGARAVIGVGLGALLGASAAPVGVAAGIAGAAAVTVDAGGGVSVVAGAVIADAIRAADRGELEQLAVFMQKDRQYAVVAEVSESWNKTLDNATKPLGCTVHRRSNDDAFTGTYGRDYTGSYMYPNHYEPMFM